MFAHGIAEQFGRTLFKNIHQSFVRNKCFEMQLFFQHPAFVNIIENRQQHFLELPHGFIAGDLV